jgi:endonuclease/exonuclease/phosphatase family metal-dependent hydrolase
MRRTLAWFMAWLVTCLPAGCVHVTIHGDPDAWAESMGMGAKLRVATYNTSLYDDASGGLIRRLETGDARARKIAAVLQRVRPDLALLNEFDYDAQGRAADLFQRNYLEVAQSGGGDALHYPYRYLAPVNTGVPSGLDLNHDGSVGKEGRQRGDDAWGYGVHPGQYGMLVLSRYPIDTATIRTFQLLKWSAIPGAQEPRDANTGLPWYPAEIWTQLRLSSKSHWDVPVRVPGGIVHFLVSHPTPPVFDGTEDRNGARNADELRLWQEYISTGWLSSRTPPWLCDDQDRCGGLAADARFIIAGDLNSDPIDGDGRHEAILALLEHPRVLRYATPRSEGAVEVAQKYALLGVVHRGAPAHATGDFGPKAGTLRLDYVLPSVGFRVEASGVFWPASGTVNAAIADGSDHHLVWLDLDNTL